MKKWILVVTLLLCLEMVLSKSSDKQIRKKFTSLKKKPTKSPKTTLDAFKELPVDDLEFIKELDRQFKQHGDKIKIKIERDNSTKNSKRTIDGDLGYGYAPHQRFHFSPPKYMLYPYSQRDIPPGLNEHYKNAHGKTSVTIEPSQAYEIKETRTLYDSYNTREQLYEPIYHHSGVTSYQQQTDTDQNYVEPVIVLRIPGPSKYALHLQALLQQYLEIRAAQYIKALQEAEIQQQHHSYQQEQNHQNHEQNQIQQYVPQHHNGYQQQYEEVQIHVPEANQQHYEHPEQEQVYANTPYSHSQQEVPEQHQSEGQQDQGDQHYQIEYEQPPPEPALTNPVPAQVAIHSHHPSTSYQYVHEPMLILGKPHFMPHVVYGPPPGPAAAYLPPHPSVHPSHQGFPKISAHAHISENNPRTTHTKVIFTHGDNHDDSTAHSLPTVTPAPRRYEPAPADRYHDNTHDNYEEGSATESDYRSDDESVVAITQRPFNYHAHSVKQMYSNKKRNAPTPEEQFRKLNKLIDRLKQKTDEDANDDS